MVDNTTRRGFMGMCVAAVAGLFGVKAAEAVAVQTKTQPSKPPKKMAASRIPIIARIVGAASAPGEHVRYAWQEVVFDKSDPSGFVRHDSGRSGGFYDCPAFEFNDLHVPAGSIVIMFERLNASSFIFVWRPVEASYEWLREQLAGLEKTHVWPVYFANREYSGPGGHVIDSGFVARIFTPRHSYHVTVKDDYLGCIMSNRFPDPGETWTRGRDLADGKRTVETWNRIIADIINTELQDSACGIKTINELRRQHGLPAMPRGDSWIDAINPTSIM